MRPAAILAALALVPLAIADPTARAQQVPDPMSRSASSVFYARQQGNCTWTPAGDVGPCINQALQVAATAGGGTVVLPAGIYGLATKVVWPTTNPVALRCPSGSGSGASATTLKWIGAAAGRMVEIRTDTSNVKGPEINHCNFDGNAGLAADGLYLSSVDHGHFDDLSFNGGFNGGNIINLTVDSATGQGSQNNTFDNLFIANGVGGTYTSNQFRLGAYVSASDGVHGNAAFNVAKNILIGGNGGIGILCEGCDNNYFSGRVFNATQSIHLTIAQAGSHLFPANGNVFGPMMYAGPFVVRGTASFPGCTSTGTITCTFANELYLDQTNASPQPTVEPGAGLLWRSNTGYASGLSLIGKDGTQPALMAAHDYSIWGACFVNSRLYGTQATSYLCNSQSAAYVAFDSIAGDRFQIDHSGSGGAKNLRFTRTAGTGMFQFDAAPVQMSVATVGTLPACGATRKYAVMAVSDQSGAPTYRGALTGGGSLAVLAYCNGSAWEAH